ncbi:hypothetical protein TNCV_4023071 [Trichonephila clavipes]|nr:hypothetical protein TNCV_4023071 [Trichonephila clavipes]
MVEKPKPIASIKGKGLDAPHLVHLIELKLLPYLRLKRPFEQRILVQKLERTRRAYLFVSSLVLEMRLHSRSST